MHPTSPRFRAALFVVLATLGLVGSVARPAQAADDWTAAPAANEFGSGRESYGYTLNPGGTVEDAIVLANHGSAPLKLTLRAADAATNRAGELDLVTKDAAAGVSAWASLDQGDVTVQPGDSLEVPFTLTLPDDAKPGDYAGGIVVSDPAGRAGLPIRLRVGGALEPSLAVEHIEYGDDAVSYTVRNTGNATLSAEPTVSVSGPFGTFKEQAGKLAPTPPLLPGETWTGSAPVEGVAPALRLTATVSLVPLLVDAAGSTSPLPAIEGTGHSLALPWVPLLIIVVVLALAVAAVKLRPRPRAQAV